MTSIDRLERIEQERIVECVTPDNDVEWLVDELHQTRQDCELLGKLLEMAGDTKALIQHALEQQRKIDALEDEVDGLRIRLTDIWLGTT